MVGAIDRRKEEVSDPVLTRLVEEDKVIWYKKKNLRFLYFMLFPACMAIESTSGFDSQIINTVQIVPSWQKCELLPSISTPYNLLIQ